MDETKKTEKIKPQWYWYVLLSITIGLLIGAYVYSMIYFKKWAEIENPDSMIITGPTGPAGKKGEDGQQLVGPTGPRGAVDGYVRLIQIKNLPVNQFHYWTYGDIKNEVFFWTKLDAWNENYKPINVIFKMQNTNYTVRFTNTAKNLHFSNIQIPSTSGVVKYKDKADTSNQAGFSYTIVKTNIGTDYTYDSTCGGKPLPNDGGWYLILMINNRERSYFIDYNGFILDQRDDVCPLILNDRAAVSLYYIV